MYELAYWYQQSGGKNAAKHSEIKKGPRFLWNFGSK